MELEENNTDSKAAKMPCEEVPLDSLLSSFLTNDALKNVSLQGNDGIIVRANRHILAARSPVFERMLFGDFAEASKDTIEIGYNGSILQAVVEYIHTDTPEILRLMKNKRKGGTSNDNAPTYYYDVAQVQTLVSLTGAALYFNLPGLARKAQECLSRCLKESPSASFIVFEACRAESPSIPQEIEKLALKCLRTKVVDCPNESEIAVLSPLVLEEILKDRELAMDEFQLFELIRQWADIDTDVSVKNIVDRKSLALRMTKLIQIERIDPSLLSSTVVSSGLVTKDQLFEAYKRQALVASIEHSVVFQHPRNSPNVWESSNSCFLDSDRHNRQKVELLKHAPMTSGIHQWTIRSESQFSTLAVLGVVISPKSFNRECPLGKQFGGWGYTFDGETFCCGHKLAENLLDFEDASDIALTLNLTPDDPDDGSLTASVDGGPAFQLFRHMRFHVNILTGRGFVPAATLYNPARIRVLNVRKLKD